MSKKILFLFANRPFPLQINFMKLLERKGGDCSILYMNRKGSLHNVPLSKELRSDQCYSVTWRIGSNIFSKIFNKVITICLFSKRIVCLKPHVVHAWNFEMLLAAMGAKVIRRKLVIVFTLQDTMPWMTKKLNRWFQRWAYSKVDYFFVTSKGFVKGLLDRYKLVDSSKSVAYVPNVPPSNFFDGFCPKKPESGELVVGCVGTLRGREGMVTLVEAVAEVRRSGANVRVIFAGSGHEQGVADDFSRKYDFVEYLGPYRYEDILDIYKKIDVFYAIYDRSYDKKIHLAYRFCESVCCGIPIITAAESYMSDVTAKFNTGVSVAIGEVGSLAVVLGDLLRRPDVREDYIAGCVAARGDFVLESYEEEVAKIAL